MKLDARIPSGPIEQAWDNSPLRHEAGQPRQQAQAHHLIVVGSGLAGASAAASLGELGYNVKCFCFQDQPAPRPLHRRAGRHQRRQELPERRRQRLPPLLRHRQRRRLPRPRSQRLSPRADQRQHHRPVRRPGRALRARIRRLARQPLLRRRAGLAHLLRPRPDRPAASARRLPGARAPDRRRHRSRCSRAPRCSTWSSSTATPAASSRATWSPAKLGVHAADAVVLATGGYGNVFYLSTNAKGSQRHRHLARLQARRALRQSLLHADSPDLHPGLRRLPVQAHAHVRVAAQRRPHLGAQSKKGDKRPPDQIPEAERDYYLERSYPSFGNLVPRDVASRNAKEVCDEGRGVGRDRPRRLSRLRRRHQAPGRERHPRALRQPLRHVRAHHRRERLQGPDAHLPRHPLHHGRPLGGLQSA